MMDKLASDAYSQGAYQALAQMNLPGHIKQAAAQHLIKEAIPGGAHLSAAGKRIADAFKMKNVRQAIDTIKGRGDLGRMEALKGVDGLRGAALKDIGIAGGLTTAGGLGTAYGLGAFDEDEGLSNAQIAGLAALGVGGAGLAAHQAGLLG